MEYKKKGIISLVLFVVLSFLIFLSSFVIGFNNIGIFILIAPFVFLFLMNYYFSLVYFEKRKRNAFLFSLISILYILLLSLPFGMISPLGILFIGLIIFIVLGLISIVIAQYCSQLEKIKYAFLTLVLIGVIVIIMSSFTSLLFSFRDNYPYSYLYRGFNFQNLLSELNIGIGGFIMIFSHISLAILIGINIFLNKKEVEETKKKRIMFIWIPLIFFILLLFFVGIRMIFRI